MNRYESMIDLWIWILTWKIWLGYDHDRSMFDVLQCSSSIHPIKRGSWCQVNRVVLFCCIYKLIHFQNVRLC